MYKQSNGVPMPTANLAINKSRLKVYGKKQEVPTYYLSKGQEFQIELFNPTTDTIMAKIFLNGKAIAQGGLVLRPAERVFLDRYIDVAKKFKFDTYEVANTSESRKAIEDNGDFKVEFYKEQTPNPYYGNNIYVDTNNYGTWDGNLRCGSGTPFIGYNSSTAIGSSDITLTSNSVSDNLTVYGSSSCFTSDALSDDIFTASADVNYSQEINEPVKLEVPNLKKRKRVKSKKSIETGRVEMGSTSEQELETVYKNWEYTAFHTIEYKMLPVSQKVNTIKDVKTKVSFCTECGANKIKASFKFCPDCGHRI